jgi:hypothetical protein
MSVSLISECITKLENTIVMSLRNHSKPIVSQIRVFIVFIKKRKEKKRRKGTHNISQGVHGHPKTKAKV